MFNALCRFELTRRRQQVFPDPVIERFGKAFTAKLPVLRVIQRNPPAWYA
jgi:hypothetical protein